MSRLLAGPRGRRRALPRRSRAGDAARPARGARRRPQTPRPARARPATCCRPGTILMVSIYLVHNDPETYPEPEKFRPERFLGGAPRGRGLDPLRRRRPPLPGRQLRAARDEGRAARGADPGAAAGDLAQAREPRREALHLRARRRHRGAGRGADPLDDPAGRAALPRAGRRRRRQAYARAPAPAACKPRLRRFCGEEGAPMPCVEHLSSSIQFDKSREKFCRNCADTVSDGASCSVGEAIPRAPRN